MKSVLFGRHIEPACEYCELGRPTRDGQMILCEKKRSGVAVLFLPEICVCTAETAAEEPPAAAGIQGRGLPDRIRRKRGERLSDGS